ncbi:MAG TPA: UPF0158 family protein [Bryobacteraceae bacterium]|nr:UPF0158 family protein [Bryobacteraceae bacterium]
MPAKARLKAIVEALGTQFEERPQFLDLETGEVVDVSVDLLHEAEAQESDDEGEPDLPEWQKEEWQLARQIIGGAGDRFLKLPDKFEVHEGALMEDFSHSVESIPIREDLLHAIHGRGAFRMFKDTLRRYGIESAWFAFREEALRQIAIRWCQEHHVVWE